jgi:hypothetical protein
MLVKTTITNSTLDGYLFEKFLNKHINYFHHQAFSKDDEIFVMLCPIHANELLIDMSDENSLFLKTSCAFKNCEEPATHIKTISRSDLINILKNYDFSQLNKG